MKPKPISLLLIIFVLLLAAQVQAAVYYVSNSGSDTNSCNAATNSATPKQHIMNIGGATGALACLASNNGDVLDIRGGTYNEVLRDGSQPWPSGSASAPTVLRVHQGETVQLTPPINQNAIQLQNTQYVTFDGSLTGSHFNITCNVNPDCIWIGGDNTNCSNTISCAPGSYTANHIRLLNIDATNSNGNIVQLPAYGGGSNEFTGGAYHGACNGTALCYGFYVQNANNLFQNLKIYGNGGYGVHNYEQIPGPLNPHDNTYRYNEFYQNGTGTDQQSQSSQAILLAGGANNKAYSNVIHHHQAPNGSGLAIYGSASNTLVYNNTFYANANNNLGVDSTAGSGSIIRNNIMYGTTLAYSDTSTTKPTVDHNYCGTGNTYSNNGCTVIGGDPIQSPVTGAGGNWNIQSGSTARDAGIDISGSLGCTPNTTSGTFPCLDYAGTPRPQPPNTGSWDIGAYEFQAAAGFTVVINSVQAVGPPAVTCNPPFTNCVVGNASVTVSGTSTQTGGTVAWTSDREATGANFTGVSSWSGPVALKAGINHITVTGTDGTGVIQIASVTITYAPTFPGNSLVLALGMEDITSGATSDSSGNKNNANLTSSACAGTAVQTTAGKYGKAFTFNGSNQCLTILDSNSLDLTQSFTISAWVAPTVPPPAGFRPLLHKNSQSSGVNSPYELYASIQGYCGDGGVLGRVQVNGSGTSAAGGVVCSAPPLQINVWTFIAVTYDNATSTMKLFRSDLSQSAFVVTTTQSGYIEPSTDTLQIAGSEFAEFFQGAIDEVRLYNFALPLTGGSNTTFGAPCDRASEINIATASIIGDANCSIVALTPPLNLKVSGTVKFSGTGKLGSK